MNCLLKLASIKEVLDKAGDFAIDHIDKVLKFLKQAVDEKCNFQETMQLLKSLFR